MAAAKTTCKVLGGDGKAFFGFSSGDGGSRARLVRNREFLLGGLLGSDTGEGGYGFDCYRNDFNSDDRPFFFLIFFLFSPSRSLLCVREFLSPSFSSSLSFFLLVLCVCEFRPERRSVSFVSGSCDAYNIGVVLNCSASEIS